MNFSTFAVWWKAQWATTFGMSRISRPGEGDSTYDTIRFAAQTATSPEVALQFTRAESYGDIIIPPPEAPAWYFSLGAGGIAGSGAVPERPTDGKTGDRGLYVDAGARLHLYGKASATPGKIRIDSATGGTSPQDVVVNGGTAKVARKGDKTRGKLRVVWIVAAPSPPTFTLTISALSADGLSSSTIAQFTAIGAVIFPPTPGLPVDIEYETAIAEGAEHFLG